MEISTYEQQAIDFLASTQTEFTTKFKTFGSMPWDKDGQKRNIFEITLKNARHSYTFDFGSSLVDSCKPHSKLDNDEIVEIPVGFTQGEKKDIIFSFKIVTGTDAIRTLNNSSPHNWERLINTNVFDNAWLDYELEVTTHNAKAKRRGERGYHIVKDRRACKDIIIGQIVRYVMKLEKETSLGKSQADTVVHPSTYNTLTCLTKSDPIDFENFCSEYGYDTDSRSALRTFKAVRNDWQNVSKLFTDQEIEQLQEIN